MPKLTGGPGWAFVPENEQKAAGPAHPRSPQPKVHVEKRSGKQVTVITGLQTCGADRLNGIARELKIACGAGGTVKNGAIEIQGDKTAQVQNWLKKQRQQK
jgi:predicted translation initiation factor SUI1